MSNAVLPGYVLDILGLCRDGHLSPGLNVAHIYHAAGCQFWANGACTCQADTVIVAGPADDGHRLEIKHEHGGTL